MEQFYDDQECFVCGTRNRIGLKLSFQFDRETNTAEATVSFQKLFQGWANVVHGGLISTVLDEIMVKTAAFLKLNCVTAEMRTKFLKPARIETSYQLTGRIRDRKGSLVFAEGSLTDPETGKKIAVATATLYRIDARILEGD
jgi:acyl-coenzyme A thioesterase PaaI-like protein